MPLVSHVSLASLASLASHGSQCVHVGVEAYCCSNREKQAAHTVSGRMEEGSGSSLDTQLSQKTPLQFLHCLCRKKTNEGFNQISSESSESVASWGEAGPGAGLSWAMFSSYLCLQERVVLLTHGAHGRLADLHKRLVLQRSGKWNQQQILFYVESSIIFVARILCVWKCYRI